MRTIEKSIIDTINEYRANADLTCEKRLSTRDSVRRDSDGAIVYRLHYTDIARVYVRENVIVITNGGYCTNTTKSRINALATAFGFPRVYQKDFAWYTSNGESPDYPATYPMGRR